MLRSILLLCWLAISPPAPAAELPRSREFRAPDADAPIVIVISGLSGLDLYDAFSRDLAAEGFHVVLLDARDVWPRDDSRRILADAIARARGTERTSERVGIVGLSQGGGAALHVAARMPGEVAAVVAWYPATGRIADVPSFMAEIAVPTLMLAGVRDENRCCHIDKAREMGAAAGRSFELVEYPYAAHGWNLGTVGRRSPDARDGLQRTVRLLRAQLRRAGSPG